MHIVSKEIAYQQCVGCLLNTFNADGDALPPKKCAMGDKVYLVATVTRVKTQKGKEQIQMYVNMLCMFEGLVPLEEEATKDEENCSVRESSRSVELTPVACLIPE